MKRWLLTGLLGLFVLFSVIFYFWYFPKIVDSDLIYPFFASAGLQMFGLAFYNFIHCFDSLRRSRKEDK